MLGTTIWGTRMSRQARVPVMITIMSQSMSLVISRILLLLDSFGNVLHTHTLFVISISVTITMIFNSSSSNDSKIL